MSRRSPNRFISHMLARNVRIESDLVDQLFNFSQKRLARTLLLMARYGRGQSGTDVAQDFSGDARGHDRHDSVTRELLHEQVQEARLDLIQRHDQGQPLAARRRAPRLVDRGLHRPISCDRSWRPPRRTPPHRRRVRRHGPHGRLHVRCARRRRRRRHDAPALFARDRRRPRPRGRSRPDSDPCPLAQVLRRVGQSCAKFGGRAWREPQHQTGADGRASQ